MKAQIIGAAIRERRHILHLQQKDLSEMSGVSLRTILQIEKGKGNPSLSTLQKLMSVLGIEMLLKIKDK